MFRLDTSHPDGASDWSFPPTAPLLYLVSQARPPHATALVSPSGDSVKTFATPEEGLAFLQSHLAGLAPPQPGACPARWVGYLGYDLGGLFERLPRGAMDDLDTPLFVFGFCQPTKSQPPPNPSKKARTPADATSNFTRPAFESAVTRAIDYIRSGDVFQVNLAQRLSVPLRDSPADVYSRLLANSPAWYGTHLDVPSLLGSAPFSLISNSPELFLHVSPDGAVTTRPIKGTRPLLPGMYEDLLHSVKDLAELAMIVDLLRNDLGRVCRFGSVRVAQARVIEVHPTVYHGVSTIVGQLREGTTFLDLLRGVFPCGSVTGAPKIRAMEIIDELEPHRRGAYCGAAGYLCQSGQIQFNVAIRTMTLTATHAHLPVGGGVVADSTPPAEYDETLVKAQAMLAAL